MELDKTPYIVITKRTLTELLHLAESKANSVVCIELQFAGDEWPGQMNITKEMQDELWDQKLNETEKGEIK